MYYNKLKYFQGSRKNNFTTTFTTTKIFKFFTSHELSQKKFF